MNVDNGTSPRQALFRPPCRLECFQPHQPEDAGGSFVAGAVLTTGLFFHAARSAT